MYEIVIGRNERDRKKYGLKGCMPIAKHYVKMGQTSSLANPIYIDAVRSHVLFICGKRGSGKCLAAGTRITLEDGRRVPIEELADDRTKILALGDDLKIRAQHQTHFYTRETDELLDVTLRSGKTLSLTREHPLLTIEGWKPIGELDERSRIATPRRQRAFGTNSLPEAEVKLLAYLIAEGHIDEQLLFTNTDATLMEDFVHAVHEYDPNLRIQRFSEHTVRINGDPTRKNVVGRGASGQFTKQTRFVGYHPLKERLRELGLYGTRSATKFVPQAIHTLTRHQLSLFLNRLFSCDGSIYEKRAGAKRTWQISYASASERLIDDVHHLLSRFGILAKRRTRTYSGTPQYELVIDSEHVTGFIANIGFTGKKRIREARYLEQAREWNPNTDTIPKELWDRYTPKSWAQTGRALGYAHPKALRESKRYAPSRQKLARIAQADVRADILALAQSDIYWDEIVSIQRRTGRFTVYDLTVPEDHNFVANDVIVHNSYTMGVLAESLGLLDPEIKENIATVIFDTMGVFWTMKYPNKQDRELVEEWGLNDQDFDVSILVPEGKLEEMREQSFPVDGAFSVPIGELDGESWCSVFSIDPLSEAGAYIHRITDEQTNFEGILGRIKEIDAPSHLKMLTENLFETARGWGLFSEHGTPIKHLAVPGRITVLDISSYANASRSQGIRSLVIGMISQKLFAERMDARKVEEYESVKSSMQYLIGRQESGKKMPLIWLFVDEAHEFLPKHGSTLASEPLITLLREGRQPGISLVLASQQPGQIHTDVLTQSDIVLSHRLTAKIDIEALGLLMQSYLREGLDKAAGELPRLKGSAIIFDDTNERMYTCQIRPRYTWHGGSSPTALRSEK
ncbi:MAG: LAGLIDADG family homing endonuclease [Candidatus Woesearchaeota archaeon]